jgi:hypothetical protein
MNEPITYESVTAGDPKRRVIRHEVRAVCPKCFNLTFQVIEQYHAGGRWNDGRVVGEHCRRCDWHFDYRDNEDAS